MPNQLVTLLKSGNRLVVEPTTPEIRDLLGPTLTFTEKKFFHGWELRKRKTAGELPFDMIDWECFGEDHKNRIACGWGFWKRIKTALASKGYKTIVRDLMPHPHPEVFAPRWDRLKQFDIELRPGQDKFLTTLFSHRCGRMWCPPGFGKSYILGVIGLLCPKARIDIISRRVPVIRERIYPELAQMLPDVGIVGGGMCNKGHRVMLYTIGSMHHATGDCDLLFCDECHEAVSDNAAYQFGIWDSSRNYGFSATQDMRMDGKDLRGEGIFGPIIYTMDYAEAENKELVVPIEIHWTSVVMDIDPCEGTGDDVEKNRRAYWTNNYRNDLIAEDARRYDEDTQVLITCATLEHAVNLKARLPEFALVYREDGMSAQDKGRYVQAKFIAADEPAMTIERRRQLTEDFESGKLKKVICTTVWNVGVSFNDLSVLIRADGGGSAIGDTQIPGRTSRVASAGKIAGIVHDYMDHFNTGCERKSKGRAKNYEVNGWKQVLPGREKKGSLASKMFWE